MTANPYPHLGFNPAPGSVSVVSDLTAKLRKSAQTIADAHKMIENLRSGSSWEGDAAVAFREQLDGALPTNLKNAHTSITKAAAALTDWQQALDGYQDRARTLNGQAKEAKDQIEAAEGREKSASANPDLKLAGKTFTDDAALKDAQSRLDRATEELNKAREAVNNAKTAYNDVIKRAKELEEDHSTDARGKARVLRDSTDKLAPEEPNWFEKSMDWVGENLTDVLGAVAAIAGLAALFFAVPVGPVLLLVAAAASAATLISRLSNPVVRASLKDGFTKGEFDADFWNNAVGVVGDTLGVVPGVGAVARGVNGAVRSANAGAEALTLGQKLSSAGGKTWLAAQRIHAAENPLTTWLVKGTANPSAWGKAIDGSVAGAGALTGTYGVAKNLWDDIKHPGAENTATGMDGFRAGSFDGAGHGATALKTMKILFGAAH
ncbi:putative T7SS-secreted protein [Streptomyces sp. NPDC052020]|uniref:putative T7SS-secreted protein n=1 Tax=Streptomyces sp. NPDC052020 TaxID=3155677 RepID=UPI0034211669